MRWGRAVPFVVNVVPICVFLTFELDAPFLPSFFILAAGVSVVLLYGVFLRFFGLELCCGPVLEEVSRDLPDGPGVASVSVPVEVEAADRAAGHQHRLGRDRRRASRRPTTPAWASSASACS